MSEWISVEDELPEHDTSVLVYHQNWGVEISQNLSIGLLPDMEGKATHWQPIPEPPKDK